jgi:hypothetical protein
MLWNMCYDSGLVSRLQAVFQKQCIKVQGSGFHPGGVVRGSSARMRGAGTYSDDATG